MSIAVRRFTDEGIKAFQSFVETSRLRGNIDTANLTEILFNEKVTEIVDGLGNLEEVIDSNKLNAAKYLSESLNLKSNPSIYYDSGLWAWLSALYFKSLIPRNKSGELKFSKDNSLYIPTITPRNRWHRHLLAFIAWVYSDLGMKGRIYLRGDIFERGDVVEQLSSVRDIQRNPGIIEAATVLFYDEKSDSIKKGVASHGDSAGTAVRFREVLQQFKLTFDLNAMDGLQIVNILPLEFNRWQKAS
jgi:hypothetical protein